MLQVQWILWQALQLIATEWHRSSSWPRSRPELCPSDIRVCCKCREGCLVTTYQCEDLGWIAQHIPFSLGSWCDDGPRVLLKGLLDHLFHPCSRRCTVPSYFSLLVDINITSPDSLMKIQVSQMLFFIYVLRLFAPCWEKCLTMEGRDSLTTLQSQGSVEP